LTVSHLRLTDLNNPHDLGSDESFISTLSKLLRHPVLRSHQK
jgi:hypothetical protein